jgi:hypothetical protein
MVEKGTWLEELFVRGDAAGVFIPGPESPRWISLLVPEDWLATPSD